MNHRRSESYHLALAFALILTLLLTFLIVLAWRTNAVLLHRRDSPPAAVVQPEKTL